MLSRRAFTAGAATSALVNSYGHAADPITWGWVATEIGKGALAFIGGRILGSLAGDPSNKQILDAIDSAVIELKNYIRVQARLAVIEGQVRDAKSFIGTADMALRDFVQAQTQETLGTAYHMNSLALNLSMQLGEAGIPTFAISVSQRMSLEAVRSRYYKKPEILSNFRDELAGTYYKHGWNTFLIYIKSLQPSERMGPYKCTDPRPDDSWRMSRRCSGFCTKPPNMACYANIDGADKILSEGDYYNADDWDHVNGIGLSQYNKARSDMQSKSDEAFRAISQNLFPTLDVWQQFIRPA